MLADGILLYAAIGLSFLPAPSHSISITHYQEDMYVFKSDILIITGAVSRKSNVELGMFQLIFQNKVF